MGVQQRPDQKGRPMESCIQTNRGLSNQTVMFFGMCNSPATFQAMMELDIADMIERKESTGLYGRHPDLRSYDEELERLTKES